MDSRPVKIYSTVNAPRLRYIAGIILGDILGLSWEVITDKRKLGKHSVINYSVEDINATFKITPDSLLFETGIISRDIVIEEWNGLPVFFKTSPDSDLPFDIFAASFFLVSRYEEYFEFQPDEHGRFGASSSLAFRHGFLGIPIIDRWVKELARVLVRKFQTLAFRRCEYKALLTVDTDQPFAYLGKSLFRSIGSLFFDSKKNSVDLSGKYRILAGEEKDPFDVFDYIIENIELSSTDACFFVKVGNHSKYDRNPSWKSEDYRKLIRLLSDKYRTCFQASYYAADDVSVFNVELSRLISILNKEIRSSRFHYIKLSMPSSYREIEKAGIIEEYSMGYPEEPGFRAGIARPYYYYDIPEDRQTKLKIIPFQIMDETLIKTKNFDPDTSREIILKLINETRKVGGQFVSIWHNTSLLEHQDCHAWRGVFEFMLKNQRP